ncbi:hypothetical protein DPMN_077635 [Dreissena polymorpha]|uniref:Uncharacterized protein n=1 Tax=Dreissena polymorpha TaxID=45954 RepID=A0A9D3YQD7_DREPO|nr:hypothetical protein DPMN_077635 [Dreissena polymorpha]
MRERDSTMATMRHYDDDSATIRWRQCDSTMARMRERDSTMTTMRQRDDDSATIRWRHCDSTMATMRERDSTMTTVRQCDNDSVAMRWRQCDSTMATMRECDSNKHNQQSYKALTQYFNSKSLLKSWLSIDTLATSRLTADIVNKPS